MRRKVYIVAFCTAALVFAAASWFIIRKNQSTLQLEVRSGPLSTEHRTKRVGNVGNTPSPNSHFETTGLGTAQESILPASVPWGAGSQAVTSEPVHFDRLAEFGEIKVHTLFQNCWIPGIANSIASAPRAGAANEGEVAFDLDFGGRECRWFGVTIDGPPGSRVRFNLIHTPPARISEMNPLVLDGPEEGLYSDPSLESESILSKESPLNKSSVAPSSRSINSSGWHFLPSDQIFSNGASISFVVQTKKPQTTVALHVPYTARHIDELCRLVRGVAGGKVIDVELPAQGSSRKVKVLLVGDTGSPPGRPALPSVLLYGAEVNSGGDAGWVVDGAVRYLCSDDPGAKEILRHVSFLCIPSLDPTESDYFAGNGGVVFSFDQSFDPANLPDYAKFFQNWIDDGHRLDLAVSVVSWLSSVNRAITLEPFDTSAFQKECAIDYDDCLRGKMPTDFSGINDDVHLRGSRSQLAGWLGFAYATLPVFYEINSQFAERHLNVWDLRAVGVKFIQASDAYLKSTEYLKLARYISEHMEKRKRHQSLSIGAVGKSNPQTELPLSD